MNKSGYYAYLASRDWALKREAVRTRAKGRCERCRKRAMVAVHHLTYERLGNELLSDLQAICGPCHEFLSAKRDVDPMDLDRATDNLITDICPATWEEFLAARDRALAG